MARLKLNDRTNQLRLTGRMQEVFWPRYRPSLSEQLRSTAWIAGLFLFAIFASTFISVTRLLWLTPLFLIFPICDGIRAYNRSIEQGNPLSYRHGLGAAMTFTYVWIVAVLVPSAASFVDGRLWHILTLGLSFCMATHFAHKLAQHFLYYLTAHHGLSAQSETKWRKAFRRMWRFSAVPSARAELTDAERRVFDSSSRVFRWYSWRYFLTFTFLVAVGGIFWISPGRSQPTLVAIALFCLLGALYQVAADWIRSRSQPRVTWLAIQNWLNSPNDAPESEMAPWSARGPFGHALIRRDIFASVVVATTALSIAWLTAIDLSFGANARLSDAARPIAAPLVAAISFTELSELLAGNNGAAVVHRLAPLLLVVPLLPIAAFLFIHWLVGPTLFAGYRLFEHESSPEHERHEFQGRRFQRTLMHGISDRLRHSPHADLRRCIFIGWRVGADNYPVLLASPLWTLGMHVLGAMRSGKTHRFFVPVFIQKILQNTGPDVVIDLKGDSVMFQAVRMTAESCGRKFLYFTNIDHFSTYLFNPLLQKNFQNLTISQFSEIVINALNLWHGFFYGGLHFSAQSLGAFGAAMRMEATGDGWVCGPHTPHVETFDELGERIRRALKDHPEFNGATSLVMVIRELSNILQINFSSKGSHFPQSAVDAAIHAPDLLVPDANGNYPVVYFFLRTESQIVGSSQMAKLFVHAIKNARIQRMDQYKLGLVPVPPPITTTAIDEWQMLADSSIHNLLEQGAGLGVHFLLANQDISQLERNNNDLLSTVWENCASKIIFTARDPMLQDRIMKISGEKTVHTPTYQVSADAFRRGEVTSDSALETLNGEEMGILIQEVRAPLIERNDLIELSDHPSRFLFIPSQGAAETSYGGYPFIVETEFALSAADYQFLDELAWPAPTSETVIPKDYREAAAASRPKPPKSRRNSPTKRNWT